MDFKAFNTRFSQKGMVRMSTLTLLLSFAFALSFCQSKKENQSQGPMQFEKKQIASESFEAVEVFDVNNDNKPDIVSGAFWYEGPDFLTKHYMGSPKRYGEYWDDFSTIPLDVNGDSFLDIVTGGWFGKHLRWRENPGDNGEWEEHVFAQTSNIEITRAWDVDGDGIKEIVPNTPHSDLEIFRLDKNGEFTRHKISGIHGHGLGFGDINGDGRGDFVVPDGWIEAPKKPFSEEWVFHNVFDFGTASVPILVEDVNGDGLADVIVGQAHGYGLDWYEQKAGKSMESTSWVKHPIDPDNSQFHTMEWADLDGDGRNELITGKRYRAHNGNDPGANDPLGMYYFQWNGESFTKHIISYGPFGIGKGSGLNFCMSDLTGSGRLDIIVAGKDGLCIFYNKGTNP